MDEGKYDGEYEEFKQLLSNLGEEKSKKLMGYLMDKVILFGVDYTNPERMFFIERLHQFKEPYKQLFGKYFFD